MELIFTKCEPLQVAYVTKALPVVLNLLFKHESLIVKLDMCNIRIAIRTIHVLKCQFGGFSAAAVILFSTRLDAQSRTRWKRPTLFTFNPARHNCYLFPIF